MAKKILYVSFGNPLTEIGGIERYLQTLIFNLKRFLGSNIEVFVAFPVFFKDGNIGNDSNSYFTAIPIKIPSLRNRFLLPFSKIAFNLFLAIYMQRHRNDYDILHIHGDNGTFALRFFDGKKLFSLHGNSVGYYNTIKDRLSLSKRISLFIATSISGIIEKYGIIHSDTTFSDQKEVLEYFKSNTQKNNLVYLPNFVDTTFFTPVDDRSSIRKKLGLNPREHYALWVGTSPQRKRLDLAVRSINQCNYFNLIVVGPKIYSEEKIISFGFVEDQALLADIYRSCEVLLLTSSHEGQSIALLESMASGCIPIIRKYLAIPGFADGYNCFLAADDDSFISILGKIEKKLDSLNIMCKNVRELACNSYSTERGISTIRKFYEV